MVEFEIQEEPFPNRRQLSLLCFTSAGSCVEYKFASGVGDIHTCDERIVSIVEEDDSFLSRTNELSHENPGCGCELV